MLTSGTAAGRLANKIAVRRPSLYKYLIYCIAAEDINVFVDYTGAYEDGETLEDKTGGRLSLNKFFFDDR